ncbi:hypothetical protein ACFU3E_11665 [Streptomyces sp. NPDC057424]|uniref:hypothetical protein n=1 Tax=Streptomyces sp. NPDC057424 TaxID=3346127 RepID=UPI0036C931D7
MEERTPQGRESPGPQARVRDGSAVQGRATSAPGSPCRAGEDTRVERLAEGHGEGFEQAIRAAV